MPKNYDAFAKKWVNGKATENDLKQFNNSNEAELNAAIKKAEKQKAAQNYMDHVANFGPYRFGPTGGRRTRRKRTRRHRSRRHR